MKRGKKKHMRNKERSKIKQTFGVDCQPSEYNDRSKFMVTLQWYNNLTKLYGRKNETIKRSECVRVGVHLFVFVFIR